MDKATHILSDVPEASCNVPDVQAEAACTLTKDERLHGKINITALISKGRYGNIPKFRYCYKADNGVGFPRLMISVPKKFFKRAVKRNLLKRRIREAYRRQKNLMPHDTDLLIMYNTKEVLDYQTIFESMTDIMNALR